MDGLILFSHGSLLCGSGQALDGHAQSLREAGRWAEVAVGYMNYGRPSFLESVSRLAEAGIDRITVVPYFLVPGKFVTVDLPRHLQQARAEYPGLEFRVAEPIGFDETLAEAVLELARGARGPEAWRLDLARAAGYCEEDRACPLYGTVRCPRTVARPLERAR